jgi:Flp pilus assembly protein TadG
MRAPEKVTIQLTGRAAMNATSATIQQSVSVTSQRTNNCRRVGVSSMPSPAVSTATARSVFHRFRSNRKGSAAVEFALVAPVFFALLFAILETAIMFFASQVLETITQDAARQIMTGQAQAANYADVNAFKTAVICKAGSIVNVLFPNCAGGISVDVKSYPSFSNVTISSQIVAGNFDTSTLSFSLGGSCDIVVARLFYKWPLFVTGLGYNISNLNGNQRLLVATAAFRNEPYSGACGS